MATGIQTIAMRNIKNAYDWIIGGLENDVSDGNMTEEDFRDYLRTVAIEDIYAQSTSTRYTVCSCGGPAPKEMRFAGKQFCIDYIKSLLAKDNYLL